MSEEEIKDLALKFQSGIIESSYQINRKLEQENQQLQTNWNELKKWLEENQDFHITQRGLVGNEFNYALESEDIDVLGDVLHKMTELERGEE